MKERKTQFGIVSLFSVIFMTIAITIATGVFTLLLGEFKIAGIQRESIKAFYAADSGIECALYWELRADSFSRITDEGPIWCGEENTQEDLSTQQYMGSSNKCLLSGATEICTNVFTMPLLNGACAEIVVKKTYSTSGVVTEIRSRGKNRCNNPTVERAAEVTIRS